MTTKKSLFTILAFLLSITTIIAQCSSDFDATTDDCSGLPVNVQFTFTGTVLPGAATTYLWEFGDGTNDNSNAENVSHPYTAEGAYTVTLTVGRTGGGGFGVGCDGVQVITKTINISPTPNASITPPTAVCAGTAINFTDGSTNPPAAGEMTYSWDFGPNANPRNSTIQNPEGIIYSTSGTKNIRLTVTNSIGCSSTATEIATVEETPTTNFISNAPQCTNAPVDYTNTGTTGDPNVTYAWDLGIDAAPATSTDENPTGVLYTSAGSKIIALTATNNVNTCSAVMTKTIIINETPTVTFDVPVTPQCTNSDMDFTNTGTTGSNLTYSWDFGNDATPASSSIESPTGVSYSSSGDKDISLQITSAQGCSNSAQQTITIAETPTADFITTAPKCTNDSVNFTNTGTSLGATFLWDFGTDATPATSTDENPVNIVYTSGGSKTISLTTTIGTCTDVMTKTITINQTPTADFTNTAPACVNTDIDFTNTGTTGNTLTYSWDFGNDASPALSSIENPTGISYSTAGTKNIALQIASIEGCVNDTSIVITINETPTADFITTAPKCTNDSVNFTNTGTSLGATFLWNFGTDATPATSTDENPINVVYTSGGSKTISLTTTIGTCTDIMTKTITINQTPTADFTSTAPVCVNTDVDFTNTGTNGVGVQFDWNFGNDASPALSSIENPIGISYSTAGTKNIVLKITSSAGCVKDTNIAIIINTIPTVNAGPDTTICANTSVMLGTTPATNSSYSWLPAVYLDDNTLSNPTASPIAPVTLYEVTVTDNLTNCTAVDYVTVTMLTPLNANAGTDVAICEGDSVQIGASLIQGQTYLWTPNSIINNDTLANPIAFPTTTTTYTVAVSGNGCGPEVDEVKVTVYPTPIVTIAPTLANCVGNAINFTSTGSSGTGFEYNWDFGENATPQVSSSEFPSDIKYTSSGSKTVRLTMTFNGMCAQDTTQIIQIDPLPIVNAGNDTTICANTSVLLGGASSGGDVFSWFPTSTLNDGSISTPLSTPVAPTTQYILTLTNSTTNCINSDTVSVTMLAPLSADAGTDLTICRNDSIQIGAALIEGQSYSWSPSLGLNDSLIPSPTAMPDSSTTYTLTVTGNRLSDGTTCPSVSDQMVLTVNQLPIVDAGNDAQIAEGETIQLIASGGIQYVWSPAEDLNNAGINNPIASPTATTTYSVTITDLFGCENTDNVTISVISPEYWVPTAFTPNNDGISDIFRVRGDGFLEFEFGVISRWGEQLFLTYDIQKGWDGTAMLTREELPSGAYVFYIKAVTTDGEAINTKGIINLIR